MFFRSLFFRAIAVATVILSLASASRLVAETKTRSDKIIRAGMIGLDTSHVNDFTKIINSPQATGELANLQVVAGYPGGTDIPSSRDRVGQFTENLRDNGIEIVDTIPGLLERVDVVLLESVDGRIHLREAAEVIKSGKPLFIDKPAAGSLADVIAIYELAKQHHVPCFSSSSMRYSESIRNLVANERIGDIIGCATWGTATYQEGIPDMFFYGVHGIEGLFSVMGAGCVSVTRTAARDTDQLTGIWADGRIGTYRGLRSGPNNYGATAFGSKNIVSVGWTDGNPRLCEEMAVFFRTGKSPVTAEETIEIFAFMEAADESKRLGGVPVKLEMVLAQAKKDALIKVERINAGQLER